MENPFLIQGYKGSSYFCDRETETATLIKAALNGRDVTLFALRRLGTSSLLDHVAYHLCKKHKYAYVKSDIYNTESVAQLVKTLSAQIIHQLFSKRVVVMNKVQFFKHLVPSISFDPVTGNPEVEFGFTKPNDPFYVLEELFSIINQFPKKVYWVWDNFQQIHQYKSSELVLKHLHGLVKKSKNVQFVFSGSHSSILLSIFKQAKQPFYNSTLWIQLKSIPAEKYEKFIVEQFKKHKRSISAEAAKEVVLRTMAHTWYTQALCNRLFANCKRVTSEDVLHALHEILEESAVSYYNYRQLLSKKQWELLKAIGKEQIVYQPSGQVFLAKYNLGTSASVLQALNKLQMDEIVVEIAEDESRYFRLNDVFLSMWVKWKYKS